MLKSTYLDQLKETHNNYLVLRKGEPEGTHYYNDLTLSIERIENTIKNLEFAKTNPLVMVS